MRENSCYILAQKKEKNDSLEGGVRKRAETEGKECWKKKKELEDVGHHTLMLSLYERNAITREGFIHRRAS